MSNPSDLLDDVHDSKAAPAEPSSIADLLTTDDSGPARESVRLAKDIPPDTAAKVLQIKDRVGLPTDFVSRNADALQTQSDNAAITPQFSQDHPVVTSYIGEDPHHAALAAPDASMWGAVERQFGFMKNQAERGLIDTEGSVRKMLKGFGYVDRDNELRIQQIEKRLQYDYNKPAPGPVSNVFGHVIESAPMMAGAMGVGALGGEVGIPAGIGSSAAWGAMEFGNAFHDFSNRKDSQGNPLMDEHTARGFALLSGVGQGALFAVGGKILEEIPGMKMITGPGLRSIIASPTGFTALKTIASDIGKTGLTMGGYSGLASLIHAASGHLAEMKSDGSLKDASPADLITRLLPKEDLQAAVEAAKSGVLTGGVLGAAGGGVDAMSDYRNYVASNHARELYHVNNYLNSIRTAEGWRNIGAAIASTKMGELAPDQVEKLVSRMVPADQVFIPLEQWQSYWQSKKADPRAAFQEVTGNPDSYDEAMRTGADVQIPAARYASTIAPSEHAEFFNEHLRADPLAMSADEAKKSIGLKAQMEKEKVEARESIANAIAPEPEAERTPAPEDTSALVGQDVAKQLEAAGFSKEEAAQQAQLYQAGFRTMGQRAGIDPLELYQRYGLKVRAGVGAEEAVPPGQEGQKTIGQAPLDQPGKKPARAELDHSVFELPSDPSFKYITAHPEFVKANNEATEVVKRYAKERGIEPTPELGKSLFQELHEVLGAVRKAPAEERVAVAEAMMEKYPSLEKDFVALKDKLWMDKSPEFFNIHLKNMGELPVMDPGAKTGPAHALFAYNDQFGKGGTDRSMYNVFGDPSDPKIVERGWGSTVPKEYLDRSSIPIVGREPRSMSFEHLDAEKKFEQAAPTFYSAAERAIEAKMPAKAPGDDILGILKNTPGVRQEELDWMGLPEFLKGKKSITKEEVQDFIRQNDVQIQEVTKDLYSREEGNAKFSSYVLPGGENYREMLLTLPPNGGERAAPTEAEIIEAAKIYAGLQGDKWEELGPNGRQRLEDAARKDLAKRGPDFKSSHFDEPNILAHVRFNDRTDADGKRVLFIEEVQSDWHQKGREKGYMDTPMQKLQDERDAVAMKYMEKGIPRKDMPPEIVEYLDALDRKISQQRSQSSVPDAPFKKTWHELAIKRMLRYAAENGYDKIAWTTGDQQAERYDLSKQVDEIQYDAREKMLRVAKSGDVLFQKVVEPSALADYVGKEAAQKIIDKKGETIGNVTILSGVDLKVGGEGMKGFYDKIIPSFLNKYTKKWGGRVGETTIDASPNEATRVMKGAIQEKVNSLDITPSMKESVMQGQPLFQGDSESPLGQLRFGSSRQMNIDLLKGANLSTFLHETGHFYLEMLGDLAQAPEARPDIKADFATVLEHFGLQSRDQLTKEHHESWARQFEAYLMEGKAPSAELRGPFARFRDWLTQVYQKVSSLGVELSPKVRDVFNRMLASKEQIIGAENQQGMAPLFEDPKMVGMSDEKAARYRDAIDRAHAEAQDTVVRQITDRALREKSRAWLDEREGIEKDVEKASWEHKEFVAKEVLGKPVQTKAIAEQRAALERSAYESAKATYDAWRELLKAGIKPDEDVADELKQIPVWMKNKAGRGYDEFAQEAREKGLLGPNEDFFQKLREIKRPEKPLSAEEFVPTIVREMSPVKLNRASIEKDYPNADLKSLKGMLIDEGGITPDQAATMFGFNSGEELLYGLKTTPKRSEWIKEETDRRMLQAHPNVVQGPNLMDRAMEAVHNEQRSRVLRLELEHLASDEFATFKGLVRALGRRIPTIQEVRDEAEKTIGSKTTAETLPSLYQRAEAQSSREAQEHFLRGDFGKAFDAKQAELRNHELYRAAKNAKEQSEKDMNFARKGENDSFRARIGKAGGSYLEQFDAIHDAFDFGPATLKELGRRESLRDWVQEQTEAGFNPTVPPDLLEQASKRSWRQMSNDELHSTVDAMRNIAHLAGLKNKLLASLNERTLDETRQAIIEKLAARYDITQEKLDKPYDLHPDFITKVKGDLNTYGAWRTRMEPLFEQMGLHDLLFEPLNMAEDQKTTQMRHSVNALEDIFSVYSKEERAKFGRLTFIPELEGSGLSPNLNKMEMIMTLLHAGNEGNMTEVMRGYRMSEAQLRGIWKHLDARDVELAQKIWNFVDSFWPQIAKQERELNGLPPEKIKGRPLDITVADGSVHHVEGGYFPLVYDKDVSWRTAALGQDAMVKDMFPSYSSNTATKHNWTKARVGGGGQAPSLKFSVLTNHVFDVIHDLAYRKPVIDTYKLLNDPDIQAHIQAGAGKGVYAQMNPWIKRIAGDRQWEPMGPFEALRKVRSNMTVAELGLKIGSALVHTTSVFPATNELGLSYMMRGFKAFSDVPSATKFMWEKSEFMRSRWEDVGDRDIRSAGGRLNLVNAKDGWWAEFKAMSPIEQKDAWIVMRCADTAIAGPTWYGAYLKAMEGKTQGVEAGNEPDAVAYADQLVRDTKGSGAAKDLAPIQNVGGSFGKLLTMFYTQLNVIDNQLLGGYRQFRVDKNMGKLAGTAVMSWFIPAIASQLLRGRFPDQDENWASWAGKSIAKFPFELMPLTREAVTAFERDKYEISPVEEAVMTIIKTAKNVATKNPVADRFSGDESEWTKKDYADAMMTLGYMRGLPTRQVVQSTMRLHNWMSEEEPHDNPLGGMISVITGTKNDK